MLTCAAIGFIAGVIGTALVIGGRGEGVREAADNRVLRHQILVQGDQIQRLQQELRVARSKEAA